MTSACRRVRRCLGAFADGELPGVERLRVSQHLADCTPCAEEHKAIRDLGEMLRANALAAPAWVDLNGLAGGVISRVRAEDAQSWRAMLARAVEDWHWAIVGGGSIAAAFISVLFVSVVCWFGPTPTREDSLAAMLNNLVTPSGTLLMIATPVGRDQIPMLMQFDNGMETAETAPPSALPDGFSGPSEGDLVLALSAAVVTPDGRMSDLRLMSRPDRQRTELLLDKLEKLRAVPQTSWAGGRVSIQKLGFVTNTSVSGKAL
jgi:hypothetical protein